MSLVQGGQRLILMKGRGVFWVTWIVSRGKSMESRGMPHPFQVISLLIICARGEGGIKLHLIKYPGVVMVLLIMSWGNNVLIKLGQFRRMIAIFNCVQGLNFLLYSSIGGVQLLNGIAHCNA